MTKETKIGLLVGMGVIVFICILVSDYLAQAQSSSPADLTQLQRDEADPAAIDDDTTPLAGRDEPIPDPQAGTPAFGHGDPGYGRRPNITRLLRTDEIAHPGDTGEAPGHDVLVQDTDRPVHIGAHSDGAAPRPRIDRHHVQPGQTLWDIAVQWYGDGHHYHAIYRANRDKMNSEDDLRVGVALVIPPLRGLAETPAAADAGEDRGTPSTPAADRVTEYTIQPGDALSRIARRFYGTSEALPQLLALNRDRIRNPDRIAAGMVIRVPAERP